MGNSILHILVIWSKGLDYKEEILSDLRKSFDILKVFHCHWDKDKFLQNYMAFYAHSQYHLDSDAFRSLLQNKVNHCGDDDFTVVVLRDDNPLFENRSTSSGVRLVNTRIFDKKIYYRALTGGGHKIHSSDDAWETNHDLTLMFGLNTEDFCRRYTLDGGEANISQNCQGVGGYNSIQDFFYVLNNTIKYCVLRNHECLPDEYTVEGHGDIDLLVENKNYMTYVTLAEPVFEESYRVYHLIKIGGKKIPFDFRFIGDNYYDKLWQEDILQTRVLTRNLFYTPNSENQYYSLLYHAYIQKWEIKKDYLPKLKMYAEAIDQSFDSDTRATIYQLDRFLEAHRYEYTRANDITVVYNLDHIALSPYALRYGQFLKRLTSNPSDTMKYHSCIYEKKDSFIKVGTTSLIENEATYLQRLLHCERVPKLLRKEFLTDENETLIEISRVKGVEFNKFFGNVDNHRWSYLRSFIIRCLELLYMLADNHIAHRDFLPSNLMIDAKGTMVYLIDFGWATDIGKQKENRPKNLASGFATDNNATDSFVFAQLLSYYWYDLHYVRVICKMLFAITDEDTMNSEKLKRRYKKILLIAYFLFSPYDQWRLFCRRHRRIGRLKQSILEICKQFKGEYKHIC